MTQDMHEWRENYRADRAGHHGINAYKCDTCGKVTVTIDVDPGVTPMFLACRRTEGCEGMAVSAGYPATAPPANLLAHLDWEWALPTADEYAELSTDMMEHVDKGGLVLRPRSDRTSAYQLQAGVHLHPELRNDSGDHGRRYGTPDVSGWEPVGFMDEAGATLASGWRGPTPKVVITDEVGAPLASAGTHGEGALKAYRVDPRAISISTADLEPQQSLVDELREAHVAALHKELGKAPETEFNKPRLPNRAERRAREKQLKRSVRRGQREHGRRIAEMEKGMTPQEIAAAKALARKAIGRG